jgi:hypothetical protein
MGLQLRICSKEVSATKPNISALIVPLVNVSLSSRMLLPRVADYQAVLCPTILPYVPAAPALVTAIIPDSCDAKKKEDKLMATLSEEKKQVTAHTNLTHNASTNVCVRYFDNGKEKQERDDSSDQKPLNDDKRMKGDLQKQATSASAQRGKSHERPLHPPQSCVNPRDKLE